MKYMKRFKGEEEWIEVTHEQALNTVLGSYVDNDDVRSMLTIGNYIPCQFSEIRIYDDDGLTAMAGLMCLIP